MGFWCRGVEGIFPDSHQKLPEPTTTLVGYLQPTVVMR
jgi:hypothetical protein